MGDPREVDLSRGDHEDVPSGPERHHLVRGESSREHDSALVGPIFGQGERGEDQRGQTLAEVIKPKFIKNKK